MRDWLQLALLIGILFVTAKPLGIFMDRVFSGQRTFLSPLMGPIERALLGLLRIQDDESEQDWKQYTLSLLGFAAVTCVFTYMLLRVQAHLPLNPQSMGRLSPDLSFNATIGFNTNASWQSYSGEQSMSYFSQMVPLCFQFFVSPAIGLCASTALIRGIARKESSTLGNFWADLIRGTLYVFLPLAFVFAVVFISQGVIQNFLPYTDVTTLEGAKQAIAQGPVASQTVMKVLGTNGGGFFNANAAHPFDNPTPLTNFLQMILMLLIPSAIVYQFGHAVRDTRHGWSVWFAMAFMFVGATVVCTHFEQAGNPAYVRSGCVSSANMEGKEARFGVFSSALYASATTATSCGSVNSMHDSFTPIGGMIPLLNMHVGEVIYGGVGSGFYGMMMFILTTVFIAGLLVGRSPEYLGKKVEGREMKFVMIAFAVSAFLILVSSAWSVLNSRALSGLGNPSAHGYTEILYDITSAAMSNGSTFAGLNTNSVFWNLLLAVVLFFGRYFTMIPMLALAGSMATKRVHPAGEATFPTHGVLFAALLIAIVLLVGALTFLPALALGPIAEHFTMR
jgi:K+-transporting ATPase ATPase A chain